MLFAAPRRRVPTCVGVVDCVLASTRADRRRNVPENDDNWQTVYSDGHHDTASRRSS